MVCKLRPCLSYSRRRDRINSVLLRGKDKRGGGVARTEVGGTCAHCRVAIVKIQAHCIAPKALILGWFIFLNLVIISVQFQL